MRFHRGVCISGKKECPSYSHAAIAGEHEKEIYRQIAMVERVDGASSGESKAFKHMIPNDKKCGNSTKTIQQVVMFFLYL